VTSTADLGFDMLRRAVQGRRLENLPTPLWHWPFRCQRGDSLLGFYALGRQAIHCAIRVPSGRLFNVWIQ
jgi:hypothetical protein